MDEKRADAIIGEIVTVLEEGNQPISPTDLFNALHQTAGRYEIQEAIQIGLHEGALRLGAEFKVCLAREAA